MMNGPTDRDETTVEQRGGQPAGSQVLMADGTWKAIQRWRWMTWSCRLSPTTRSWWPRSLRPRSRRIIRCIAWRQWGSRSGAIGAPVTRYCRYWSGKPIGSKAAGPVVENSASFRCALLTRGSVFQRRARIFPPGD
jgi:hypothetical protein